MKRTKIENDFIIDELKYTAKRIEELESAATCKTVALLINIAWCYLKLASKVARGEVIPRRVTAESTELAVWSLKEMDNIVAEDDLIED